MILYVDAGCLLKRYLREDGSADVEAWIGHADFVATASISLAEVAAELARRPKWIKPSRAGRGRALERLTEDWDDYIVIETDERRAAAVAWRRNLQGAEAVQLAAALTIADMAAPLAVVFASFDPEVLRAAREEGLGVIQPARRGSRRRRRGGGADDGDAEAEPMTAMLLGRREGVVFRA